jgi:hypothetical protein
MTQEMQLVRLNVAVLRISWVQCTFFLKSYELRSSLAILQFCVWHVSAIGIKLFSVRKRDRSGLGLGCLVLGLAS